MKKIIITLLSTLFISLTIFSQTNIKPGIGFNVTTFTEPSKFRVKGKFGYQIGGSVAFGKKKFYIEPGVFWIGKSSEFSSSDSTVQNAELHAKINGVRIPLTLGFSLLGNKKSAFSMRLFGGASTFLITGVGDDMNKDDINTTNWTTYLGLGFDLWIVFIDISYEWGLNDLEKEDVPNSSTPGKPQTFLTTVGIRITL